MTIFDQLGRDAAAKREQIISTRDTNRVSVTSPNGLVMIEARLCGKTDWSSDIFEQSGGVEIIAIYLDTKELYRSDHASFYRRDRRASSRLGPGWTPEQVARRAITLSRRVREMVNPALIEERNKVWLRFEHNMRAGKVDAVQMYAIADAVKAGHEDDYGKMTWQDCAFWLNLANQLKIPS